MFITVIRKDDQESELCINVDAIVAIHQQPNDARDGCPFHAAVIELVNGEKIDPSDGYTSIIGQLEALKLKQDPFTKATTRSLWERP